MCPPPYDFTECVSVPGRGGRLSKSTFAVFPSMFFFFIEATTDKRRKSINNVCIIFAVNSRLETPDTLVYCRDGHENIVLLLYVRNRPGP